MELTTEQRAAVEARDCNLLISAAAGSGKTAILVERIIRRITDTKNPVDIDSIVVVTFTKAAASEMKERLLTGLQKALEKNPGSKQLVRQLALIDHAKICTIDSFCNFVLRNYYNVIDMDPAYRIGEGGELKLLKQEVFEKLQERYFAEGNPDFLNFTEVFSAGKNLDGLYEHIKNLYDYSQSMPWPEEWLDSCDSLYTIDTAEELMEHPLVRSTMEYIRACCQSAIRDNREMMELIIANPTLEPYRKAIEEDGRLFEELLTMKTLSGMRDRLATGFARLGTVRQDSDEKEYVKALRDMAKKIFKDVNEQFLSEDEEMILEGIRACRPYAEVLIRMTKDFAKEFEAAKETRGILDFSDVEHKALQILVRKDEQGEYRTQAARELSSLYEEIYIDEYQDSSYVQEAILNAISRIEDGTPNVFMVGDVKQSIYRFRQARPELFYDKYMRYESYPVEADAPEHGLYCKIELGKNFRSCTNVIHCVNDVFFRSMQSCVGGIDYTEECQLNYGGSVVSKVQNSDTELILVKESEEIDDVKSSELCAHAAAMKIRSMMDEDTSLHYRDFVILLRNAEKVGPIYAQVLRNHGIDASFTASAGYFATPELQDITNYLSIIDNPLQDIPLAGVMRSYYAYFSAEELAMIKGRKRNTALYECVVKRAKTDSTDELSVKCRDFLAQLDRYRTMNRMHSIEELLHALIYDSGYYDYVGVLSGGNLRKANLRLLVRKATEFGRTSYSGLFHFLRYIEKLKTYDLDYAEAPTASENEDVVRIMTIHKSKGLQFPIVILGDAAQKFSDQDIRKPVFNDSRYGVAMTMFDPVLRTKRIPCIKRMLQNHINAENIGEEIRILYVALTRAVDKLIAIGIVSDKSREKYRLVAQKQPDMPYLMNNKNYMAMLLPAALAAVPCGNWKVTNLSEDEMVAYVKADIVERRSVKFADYIEALGQGSTSDVSAVREVMEYRYPHQSSFSLRSKYSVSDLKHAAMMALDEDSENIVVSPEHDKPVPYFEQAEETRHRGNENLGTIYGDAYHKFFELMDYSRCVDAASCKSYLDELVENKRMSKKQSELLDMRKFAQFLQSPLGRSMAAAANRGELFREQPFIMEVPGTDVDANASAQETVLIQGIIDAFFYEEDHVYLVDYKTDHVDTEEALANRYRKQLVLYEEAIRKVTGKQIGGSYLYSVRLGREIRL